MRFIASSCRTFNLPPLLLSDLLVPVLNTLRRSCEVVPHVLAVMRQSELFLRRVQILKNKGALDLSFSQCFRELEFLEEELSIARIGFDLFQHLILVQIRRNEACFGGSLTHITFHFGSRIRSGSTRRLAVFISAKDFHRREGHSEWF